MKILRFVLLGFCLPMVCSCHRQPVYPPQLLEADSLASVSPDSALQVLESLKADSLQWDKATRMYHQLLTVKAHAKANLPPTSDSLMLSVLHYYEQGGDKHLLPEAYYYMGRTYKSLDDAPRALGYFQKALDVMPAEASPLRSQATGSIGNLFYRQKLYDQALTFFQELYANDSTLNDKKGMSYALTRLGAVYANKKIFTKAFDYFEKAKALYIDISDATSADEVGIQLAAYYITTGQYNEAKEAIRLPLLHVGSYHSMRSDIYNVCADIHFHLGERDSAAYYYKKVLDIGDMYSRQSAYEHLGLIAAEENRVADEADFFMKYKKQTDDIARSTVTSTLVEMYSLYNYQKSLEEREAIRLHDEASRRTIHYMSLAFLFAACVVALLLFRAWMFRKSMQDKLSEVEHAQEMMRNWAERSISEKNKRICELELQLKDMGSANAEVVNYIEQQQADIRLQLEEAEKELSQREQMDAGLRNSDIYTHIIYLINKKKKLTPKALEELIATFNAIAPHFMEKLSGICIMSELELEVTLLRRIGISPNDIAQLTSYTKQHISGVRKGLYKKVTGIDDKPSKWDEFISVL